MQQRQNGTNLCVLAAKLKLGGRGGLHDHRHAPGPSNGRGNPPQASLAPAGTRTAASSAATGYVPPHRRIRGNPQRASPSPADVLALACPDKPALARGGGGGRGRLRLRRTASALD